MILEHDFKITIELNISFLFKRCLFFDQNKEEFCQKAHIFFFKFFLVQCFPCRSRISFSISANCVWPGWLDDRWLVSWLWLYTTQGRAIDWTKKMVGTMDTSNRLSDCQLTSFSLFSFWENNKKRLRKWGWSWPDLSQQVYCFGNLNILMRS